MLKKINICLPAILIVLGSGCKAPPETGANKVAELEERMERIEMQITRLQETLAGNGDQKFVAQKNIPLTAEAKTLKLQKVGSGRTYLSNGKASTISLGSPGKGFGFQKPATFKTPKGSIALNDLELCTDSPDKGQKYPGSLDLILSPDQKFGLLVFPCQGGSENLYFLDMVGLKQLSLDFSGDFFTATSVAWAPDSSFLMVETCRSICNLNLQDSTANKIKLEIPPVFGFKDVEVSGDQKQPDCRIGGGNFNSATSGRLSLACTKGSGQIPDSPTSGEFTLNLDLDLLGRKLSLAQ